MPLRPHHVIVFTAEQAPEGASLLDAGLVEGSPNVHPGQGTANRRFFFESGFLELLWVHDEREARSSLVAPTKLWDRWAGRGRGANPFGICFSSAEGVESLPFQTWAYRPEYLSDGRCMFFPVDQPLSEPEIFVLSWPQDQSSANMQPTRHPLGLREMRTVSIGLPVPAAISGALRAMSDAGIVGVHHSAEPELVIEFSSLVNQQVGVPALGLTIVGRQPSSPAKSLENPHVG
jgi:hypothetical protein